ncbi:MAG: hypothetical protein H7Z43_12760 [Clostridia bacterium]|nr:hypothetical protein [Deltaproteobacteria bacterium]
MRTVVQNWSQSDAPGAIRFAEATGDTTVVSAAVGAWASNDPIAAADWINERHAPDDYVINSIASAWFTRDEHGAADWAMGLHDPKQRDIALSSVAQMSSYRDPASAIDLALSMTPSEERSAELRSLYVTWVSQDSAAAKRWFGDTRLLEDARRAITTDQATEVAQVGCVCP